MVGLGELADLFGNEVSLAFLVSIAKDHSLLIASRTTSPHLVGRTFHG